jgi:hypothetical protein
VPADALTPDPVWRSRAHAPPYRRPRHGDPRFRRTRICLIFQAHSRQQGPASERDAEAIDGERGENEQEKEGSPGVPGRGVGRQRELQEVVEIIADDEREETEAEKHEDEGPVWGQS